MLASVDRGACRPEPRTSLHPDAASLWRGPRWALAILLAALGTVGPFSIDTDLPAFAGIAADTGATPIQMQQTLCAYLFGFAFMNLFHGALADSFGRRPVVLWGIGLVAWRVVRAQWPQTGRTRPTPP